MTRQTDKVALLVLRYGLGIFLLIWGVDKLVDTEGAVKIFGFFYKLGISENIAQVFGWLEILLALMIIAGLFRTWTYGAGLLVHAVSTVSSIPQMLPWHAAYNHLFVAGIPVLAGFIALWLMRKKDTMWTLG